MRTLDRYIARSFIEPFAVSLTVIIGLIVVAHAFGKIEDFTRMADTLGQAFSRMGRIYLLRLPTFIAPVLPIAMLIGASFGISQLNGRNELIAMRASGVSVWRIIAPVYALAVILSFAGMANCEYLIPRAEEATARDQARRTGTGAGEHGSADASGLLRAARLVRRGQTVFQDARTSGTGGK